MALTARSCPITSSQRWGRHRSNKGALGALPVNSSDIGCPPDGDRVSLRDVEDNGRPRALAKPHALLLPGFLVGLSRFLLHRDERGHFDPVFPAPHLPA